MAVRTARKGVGLEAREGASQVSEGREEEGGVRREEEVN